MNKIINLYNFLKLSGFYNEVSILKFAAETSPEELKRMYEDLNLYRFYEMGKPTAKYGGVFAQIKMYFDEGYITKNEIDQILNFKDLILKMKELKKKKKETEYKFKYLKNYKIDKFTKKMIIEKNLSKEDFEFAYISYTSEGRDNHELSQTISEIADLREKYNLLKIKIPNLESSEKQALLSRLSDPLSYKVLDDAVREINNLLMDVNNIIDGKRSDNLKEKLLNYYDYIYNGNNKLNASYPPEAKGAAKRNSEILYNDKEWAIVRSWSEEAAQYWERGAVSTDGGNANFRTCTSRIGGVHNLTFENLYSDYSQYTMIQILKLKNGEPIFYTNANSMFTLCFNYYDDKFRLVGDSGSVNADDKDITMLDVESGLPEKIYKKLNDLISGINKYNLLSLDDFFIEKTKESIYLDLKDEKGFEPGMTINKIKEEAKNIYEKFSKNALEKAEASTLFDFLLDKYENNYYEFEDFIRKYKSILKNIVIKKIYDLDASRVFTLSDTRYESEILSKLLSKEEIDKVLKHKYKDLDLYLFISFKDMVEKDLFKKHIREKLEQAKNIEDILKHYKHLDKDILEEYLYKNMDIFVENFSDGDDNWLAYIKHDNLSIEGDEHYEKYFDSKKYLKDFSIALINYYIKILIETPTEGNPNYYWKKYKLYNNSLIFNLDYNIKGAYLKQARKEHLKHVKLHDLLTYLKNIDDNSIYFGDVDEIEKDIILRFKSDPITIFKRPYNFYLHYSMKKIKSYIDEIKYTLIEQMTPIEFAKNKTRIDNFFKEDDLRFNNIRKEKMQIVTRSDISLSENLEKLKVSIIKVVKISLEAVCSSDTPLNYDTATANLAQWVFDEMDDSDYESGDKFYIRRQIKKELTPEFRKRADDGDGDCDMALSDFLYKLRDLIINEKVNKTSRYNELSKILKKYS